MTTTTPVPMTTTSSPTLRRATWALWGSAAGIGGVLTNLALAQPLDEKTRASGDAQAIVDGLSQGRYHLTAVTGFLTVVCLLFFAAGLARWAKHQTSDSLALRVAPMGVAASAAALLVAYGVKGQLAAYLEGGFNESSSNESARYLFFLLDDLAGYYSWWGVAIAAACLAVLAFRERLIPRWIGALAVLAAGVPLAFLVVFGFTGFSGVICPVFLVVAGIGLARQRT